MRDEHGFSAGPDDELGGLLRERMTGPDEDRFLDRISQVLRRLPEPISQWDVLAGWARPGVLAAAMAAAFLLGAALYANWYHRPTTSAANTVPAAALMAPNESDIGPVTFAILEGK